MQKKNMILGVLIMLVVSPIIGVLLPWFHFFVPIAIAFVVPIDGPPFSESLLPLIGILHVLIGVLGLVVYFVSKGRVLWGLRVFGILNIVYSSLAVAIWLVFFGSRIIRYFPVTDLIFYVDFFYSIVRHVVWIIFIVWSIKTLKKAAKEEEIRG